jgi:serine/threonine protein kinase
MPGIQDRQFNNEVHHLMGLKHQNIVQLIGYCDERQEKVIYDEYQKKNICAEVQERLLCYEYMANGSLDKLVYGTPSLFTPSFLVLLMSHCLAFVSVNHSVHKISELSLFLPFPLQINLMCLNGMTVMQL